MSSNNSVGNILSSKFNLIIKSNQKFDDVIGNEEAKEDLRDIVEYLKNPSKFKNVKVPKGVLMVGPPGTGKTLLARALAGEAGVPFISVSGSEFEEVFVGLGAKRIRLLFEEARKRAPCIIFIDEIDALGGERNMQFNRGQMSLNQLLVELDGFSPSEGVIVIGATNIPQVLDSALIRPGRFDRKVYLNLPSKIERMKILDYYLKLHQISDDVNTDIISSQTPGFSGADLENMVNTAAIEATKIESNINMYLLEQALWNIAMGRERKSLFISGEAKKLTAYHEGGHAIVALYTAGSRSIRKATLIPRGDALGMVNYLPKEDELLTRKQMEALMDTAMGGRAAEMLIYGENNVTQGASSDFKTATKIARTMVTKLGMSEKVGHIHLTDEQYENCSPETKEIVEKEIRRLLDESLKRSSKILLEKQEELHLLANALLKYETLELSEIKKVIKGDPLTEKDIEIQLTKSPKDYKPVPTKDEKESKVEQKKIIIS